MASSLRREARAAVDQHGETGAADVLLQSAHHLATADDPAAAPAMLRAALAVAQSPPPSHTTSPGAESSSHQLEQILASFAFTAADASARAAQKTLLRAASAVQGRLPSGVGTTNTSEAPEPSEPAVGASASEVEAAWCARLLSLPPNELLVEYVQSHLASSSSSTDGGGGTGGDASETRMALDMNDYDDEALVAAFAAAGGDCGWRAAKRMGANADCGSMTCAAASFVGVCGCHDAAARATGGGSFGGVGERGGGGSAGASAGSSASASASAAAAGGSGPGDIAGGAETPDATLRSPVCATLQACVGRVLVSAPLCVSADGLDLRHGTAEGRQLRRLLSAYKFTIAGALAERASEMVRDVASAVASASESAPAKGRLSVAAMDADTTDEDED